MDTNLLLILILIGIIGAIIMIKGVFKSDATITATPAASNELFVAIVDRSIEGDYTNSTITKLRISVFEYCTSLTSIDLPNVTSIGNYTFYSCTSLTSIDLPNVTSIGDSAFSGCTSLTSIDLPKVTSIGNYAFSSCSKLTAIHFSASNKSKIEANSYYSEKWRATNATIYFDL